MKDSNNALRGVHSTAYIYRMC